MCVGLTVCVGLTLCVRELAPSSQARRTWTEVARRYLTLRLQEAKILGRLDRTMMFEGQTTFQLRATRIVSQVCCGFRVAVVDLSA